MCIGAPDVPVIPERQTPKDPKVNVRDRMADSDRRRRGFAATMLANNAGAISTTNVTGV